MVSASVCSRTRGVGVGVQPDRAGRRLGLTGETGGERDGRDGEGELADHVGGASLRASLSDRQDAPPAPIPARGEGGGLREDPRGSERIDCDGRARSGCLLLAAGLLGLAPEPPPPPSTSRARRGDRRARRSPVTPPPTTSPPCSPRPARRGRRRTWRPPCPAPPAPASVTCPLAADPDDRGRPRRPATTSFASSADVTVPQSIDGGDGNDVLTRRRRAATSSPAATATTRSTAAVASTTTSARPATTRSGPTTASRSGSPAAPATDMRHQRLHRHHRRVRERRRRRQRRLRQPGGLQRRAARRSAPARPRSSATASTRTATAATTSTATPTATASRSRSTATTRTRRSGRARSRSAATRSTRTATAAPSRGSWSPALVTNRWAVDGARDAAADARGRGVAPKDAGRDALLPRQLVPVQACTQRRTVAARPRPGLVLARCSGARGCAPGTRLTLHDHRRRSRSGAPSPTRSGAARCPIRGSSAGRPATRRGTRAEPRAGASRSALLAARAGAAAAGRARSRSTARPIIYTGEPGRGQDRRLRDRRPACASPASAAPARRPDARLHDLAADDQSVVCPRPASTSVLLNLGDGDDVAAISASVTLPVTINGGAGNDGLFGGSGVDTFNGGAGDDNLVARDGRAEQLNCGAGNDTAISDDGDTRISCEQIEGDADLDGVRRPADCDDANPALRPGATDVPDNGDRRELRRRRRHRPRPRPRRDRAPAGLQRRRSPRSGPARARSSATRSTRTATRGSSRSRRCSGSLPTCWSRSARAPAT